MSDKDNIRRLLEASDFASLLAAGSLPRLFRALISLAFDKQDIICWRAIEAVGRVAGDACRTEPERVRTQVQRLLWMMRDESGNNVSAAPEMLGEIVGNAPEAFSDIAPIIASFHDEEGLRRGVFYGVLKIAEKAPDLARSSSFLCAEYIGDPDPAVQAYAVLLAGALALKDCLPAIKALTNDARVVRLYREGHFRDETLGGIARETVILLNQDKG